MHLEAQLPISRSLEEGPDYPPNWRWLVTHEHIEEIESESEAGGDQAAKLQAVLGREDDAVIRQLLQFHYGVLPDTEKQPVEYAIRCARAPEAANAIKAMVVAGATTAEIAERMKKDSSSVEFFEKLHFDVRRYLDSRPWLRSVCYGNQLYQGHRWLQIAFERGWSGVKEIVLQEPTKGPRTLDRIVSGLLGRAEASLFQLEASNVAPTADALPILLNALRTYGRAQLPHLDDAEETPVVMSPDVQKFAKLPFEGRERIRDFLEEIYNQGIALETEGKLPNSKPMGEPPQASQ